MERPAGCGDSSCSGGRGGGGGGSRARGRRGGDGAWGAWGRAHRSQQPARRRAAAKRRAARAVGETSTNSPRAHHTGPGPAPAPTLAFRSSVRHVLPSDDRGLCFVSARRSAGPPYARPSPATCVRQREHGGCPGGAHGGGACSASARAPAGHGARLLAAAPLPAADSRHQRLATSVASIDECASSQPCCSSASRALDLEPWTVDLDAARRSNRGS